MKLVFRFASDGNFGKQKVWRLRAEQTSIQAHKALIVSLALQVHLFDFPATSNQITQPVFM